MNSYKQSLYTALVRICANLLMVCAIFLAMYEASRQPAWPSEAVFCLVFFGITIPVWICAWQLGKWIRRRWPAEPRSLVEMPGLGNQLVAWRVLEGPEISLAARKPVA